MHSKAASGFRADRYIGKWVGLIQVPATLGNQLLGKSAQLSLRLKRARYGFKFLTRNPPRSMTCPLHPNLLPAVNQQIGDPWHSQQPRQFGTNHT